MKANKAKFMLNGPVWLNIGIIILLWGGWIPSTNSKYVTDIGLINSPEERDSVSYDNSIPK